MIRSVLFSCLLMVAALFVLLPADAPSEAMQIGGAQECPDNAVALRGSNRSLRCRCSASATRSGSVWGTDTYTDDSRICRAAVHAGAIDSRGGMVLVEFSSGRSSYRGSTRNGVRSSDYGRWQGSYSFGRLGDGPGGGWPGPGGPGAGIDRCPDNATSLRGSRTPLRCHCAARATRSGAVWGTDVYTDDSNICRAALHAGAVDEDGGNIVVTAEGGRGAYTGSYRNGVRSSNYGRWQGSFRVARGGFGPGWPPGGGQAERCPNDASSLRGTRREMSCRCDADGTRAGPVWGTDVYTDDSRICRAAVHAGVIGDRGGLVRLRALPGRSSYTGSYRNGIRSNNYGRWQGSFEFVGGGRPPNPPGQGGEVDNCPGNGYGLRGQSNPMRCRCTATGVSTGLIYGTGTYAENSMLCRAALHAGVVGRNGGVITVRVVSGQSSYRGSTQNGVQSQNYGRAVLSFRFEG